MLDIFCRWPRIRRLIDVDRRTAFNIIEPLEGRVLLSAVAPTWSQHLGSSVATAGDGDVFNGQVTTYDPSNGDVLVAFSGFDLGPPLDYLWVGAFSPNGNGQTDASFGGTFYSASGGESVGPLAGYAIIEFEEQPLTPLGIFVDQAGDINIAAAFAQGGPGNGIQGIGVIQINSRGTSVDYIDAVESPSLSGAGEDTYTGFASAYNPKTNDILISGSDYTYTSNVNDNAIWAFSAQSGSLDGDFGVNGEFTILGSADENSEIFNNYNADEFDAITVDANPDDATYGDIYAADDSYSDVRVVAVTSDGSGLLSGFNSGEPFQLDNFAPAGSNSVNIAAIFGLAVYGGNVIIADPVSWTDALGSYTGVGLTEINAATAALADFGPNNDGQLFVPSPPSESVATWAGQFVSNGQIPVNGLMAVNPNNGDIALVYATGNPLNGQPWNGFEPEGPMVAQWVNGSTGQFETLDQTYTNSDNPNFVPSATFVSNGGDSGGLMDADIDDSQVDLSLGYYGPTSGPDTPLTLLSADSVKSQGGVDYGINLALNVPNGTLPSVEDRINGPTEITMDFQSPITLGPNFAISLTDTLSASDGAVSSYAVDGSNPDQLDIYLSGAINEQTLIVAVDSVEDTETGVSGDYSVKVGVLLGDVAGLGVVSSGDFGFLAVNYGTQANSTDFTCDINCDGVIDSADFGILAAAWGTSLNY